MFVEYETPPSREASVGSIGPTPTVDTWIGARHCSERHLGAKIAHFEGPGGRRT